MSPRSPLETRLLAAVAALAALFASLDLLANGFVYPLESARAEIGSHHDLRGPYFGAMDLAAGEDPYGTGGGRRGSDLMAQRYGIDRMATLHSPPALAAFVPLTRLRFTRAKVVMLAIGFLCALASVPALVRAVGSGLSPVALAGMLFLVGGYREIHRSLGMGQLNPEVLLLLAAGLAALRAGRDATGGALLALTTLIKPIPGIVMVGLLLRGRWRALAGGAAALGAVYGLTAALFGVQPLMRFATAVLGAAQDVNVTPDNQALAASILRIAMDEPHNLQWQEAPAAARIAWYLLAAAIGGAALWLAALRRRPLLLQLTLLLTAGLLISPRAWNHYLAWLPPAFAALVWAGADRGSRGLVAAAAVAYYAINQPARTAKIASWLLPIPGALQDSAQCAGVLLLFVALAVAVYRTADAEPREG